MTGDWTYPKTEMIVDKIFFEISKIINDYDLRYIDTNMMRETLLIKYRRIVCSIIIWLKDYSRTTWLYVMRVVIERYGKCLLKWYHQSKWLILSWYNDETGTFIIISIPTPLSFMYGICIGVSKGIKKIWFCWSRVIRDNTDIYEYEMMIVCAIIKWMIVFSNIKWWLYVQVLNK